MLAWSPAAEVVGTKGVTSAPCSAGLVCGRQIWSGGGSLGSVATPVVQSSLGLKSESLKNVEGFIPQRRILDRPGGAFRGHRAF